MRPTAHSNDPTTVKPRRIHSIARQFLSTSLFYRRQKPRSRQGQLRPSQRKARPLAPLFWRASTFLFQWFRLSGRITRSGTELAIQTVSKETESLWGPVSSPLWLRDR